MKMENIFVALFCFFVLFISLGCIESNDDISEVTATAPVSPTVEEQTTVPDPTTTIDEYVFCFNRLQTDYIYDNLLSNRMKGRTSDAIHNSINVYVSQGFKIKSYDVVDSNVSDTTANISVDIRWSIEGYQQTKSNNIKLVLENNEWKIDNGLILFQ